jgi:DNA-directed RNA polymerase subunit K/omega
MADIKSKALGMDPSATSHEMRKFIEDTGNIYESLNIIAKRARQINKELKYELKNKLEEFAVQVDTIEEIQENKEQVEISKYYERLPNPVIIAMNEFFSDDIGWKYREVEPEDEM